MSEYDLVLERFLAAKPKQHEYASEQEYERDHSAWSRKANALLASPMVQNALRGGPPEGWHISSEGTMRPISTVVYVNAKVSNRGGF